MPKFLIGEDGPDNMPGKDGFTLLGEFRSLPAEVERALAGSRPAR